MNGPGTLSLTCIRCGAARGVGWCPRCGLSGGPQWTIVGAAPMVLAGGVIIAVGVGLQPYASSWYLATPHRAGSIIADVAHAVTLAFLQGMPLVYAALAGALAARLPHGAGWGGRALVGLALGPLVLAVIGAAAIARPSVEALFVPLCAAAFGGALLGAPALDHAAEVAPFRWFAPLTGALPWPLRLAVLVPVASATLVLGATAVILALMAACTIAMIVGMVRAIFGKGSDAAPVARARRSDESDGVVLSIDPGARIDRDGRIVREGFFSDDPSGLRIDPEGRVVREGFFTDQATGVKIDAEGRIVQEGFFVDKPTGARLKDGEFVKEGFFSDDASGLGIDKDGRVVKKGFFSDKPAGVEITADGKVRERGGRS